jgi:hypothetical protein
MELIEKYSRCKAIIDLWACDNLEKSQQFLQVRSGNGHVTIENFISNSFVPHESEEWIDSYEPRMGKS